MNTCSIFYLFAFKEQNDSLPEPEKHMDFFEEDLLFLLHFFPEHLKLSSLENRYLLLCW